MPPGAFQSQPRLFQAIRYYQTGTALIPCFQVCKQFLEAASTAKSGLWFSIDTFFSHFYTPFIVTHKILPASRLKQHRLRSGRCTTQKIDKYFGFKNYGIVEENRIFPWNKQKQRYHTLLRHISVIHYWASQHLAIWAYFSATSFSQERQLLSYAKRANFGPPLFIFLQILQRRLTSVAGVFIYGPSLVPSLQPSESSWLCHYLPPPARMYGPRFVNLWSVRRPTFISTLLQLQRKSKQFR